MKYSTYMIAICLVLAVLYINIRDSDILPPFFSACRFISAYVMFLFSVPLFSSSAFMNEEGMEGKECFLYS